MKLFPRNKNRLVTLLLLLSTSIGFVGGQFVTGHQFKRLTDGLPFFMSVFFYAGCKTAGGETQFCKTEQERVYRDNQEISDNMDRLLNDKRRNEL